MDTRYPMTPSSRPDRSTNATSLHRSVMAAAILVVALLVSLLPAPALASESTVVEIPGSGPFLDDDGSLFETDIAALAEAGITSGCDVGRFCPDEHVTRAQMAAFLRRTVADLPAVGQPTAFVDVDGSVFADDIAWLSLTGITRGCDTDRFCPDRPVTRGQMAAFLRRAAGLPEGTITGTVMWDLRVPTGPGAEGWRLLVSHFFRAEDVDQAVQVIFCESSGDPNAVNKRSSATGLFQHLPRYWLERSAEVPEAGADMFDPVANAAVAAWLVYDGGGWSHWYPSEHCWG